jgi:hypothetical protein
MVDVERRARRQAPPRIQHPRFVRQHPAWLPDADPGCVSDAAWRAHELTIQH